MSMYTEDRLSAQDFFKDFDPCTDLPKEELSLEVYTPPVIPEPEPEDPLDNNITIRETQVLLSTQRAELINMMHPVGSLLFTLIDEDPANTYGGVWQKIAEGKTVIGANAEYPLGTEGGAYTVTLTEEQMPKHNHAGSSTSAAGGHSHTRGSMNITGEHGGHAYKYQGSSVNGTSGCFIGTSSGAGGAGKDGNVSVYKTQFDASKTWTGSTSIAGEHTHTLETSTAGGSKPFSIMSPYLAVIIWQRIE